MAPMKTFQVRTHYNPWLSQETKILIAERERLHKSAVENKDPEKWTSFKALRNKNSHAGRNRKKLLGKTSWYKKRKSLKTAKLSLAWGPGGWENKNYKKVKTQENKDLPTKSVIFTEQTPGGELAKGLRELIGRLQHLIGGRIKIVERTGTPLKDLFPLTNLWEGEGCGRGECYPCKQGGEEIPRCKRRNIIYESICAQCNPEAAKKGPLKKYDGGGTPSLYVGETARSLMERAREHINDFETKSKKSHIWKHQTDCHGGNSNHNFIFKIVDTPKSALSRQIGEAVLISRRGGEGAILNARGEYNRCHITRLTLGDDKEQPEGPNEGGEGEQSEEWIQNQGAAWVRSKLNKQREQDLLEGNRILSKQQGGKRTRNSKTTEGGRAKKRKYKLVDINWGSRDIREELRLDCLTSTVPPVQSSEE